jgi:hypothetical protein
MRKVLVAVVAILAATAFAVSSASAASVHLKGGNNARPTFNDQGLVEEVSGSLTGLGNGDVLVTVTATADVTATCTNPAGQTQPPGQNPAPITVSGSQSIPASEVKNGNVSFDVFTVSPNRTIAGAPGCPNRQWTETIVDLAFTSVTLTVEQPPGTVVLTQTFTL